MTPAPLVHAEVPVVRNSRLARDIFRLSVRCERLAAAIRPGQFLMLRLPGRTDPLLGRAFALYETRDDTVDIVYMVVGKMTRLMSQLAADDTVELWGPLGNGFPDYRGVETLVMVAGGIGQTPFLALMNRVLGRKAYSGQPRQTEVGKVALFYGARTADLFAGLDDFAAAGAEIHLATDDGSCGHRGFVTQLLESKLPDLAAPRLAGCGPEPMLHALARVAEKHQVPCELSLETPMACGVGICFSCVTKIKVAEGWDYRRVCVEGPVFAAGSVVW